ncbi:ferritin-like domain-containing protein [Bacillus sp. AGMB 02131]|uniref:Ferritin-like domain-containing protein n=1 Tax=Peribacillus faecalis TaxID=2772559 RepID=A0A927CYC2_9BACI|nr:ferritin-like domain-containing protein [Peribacillus faecalis]MBD3108175.1 ferritin-like domain-containing protein [Peribacillus faecalis]
MFYYETNEYMVRQQTKMVSNLEQAINGEYSAIQCYAKLAEMAPSDMAKERIREIRNDEKRHLKVFSQLYTSLTGNQPKPKITEECPDNYKKGLDFAFKDEQQAVDTYLTAADEATNWYVKDAFRRAAADEQNHAVWFHYLMTTTK